MEERLRTESAAGDSPRTERELGADRKGDTDDEASDDELPVTSLTWNISKLKHIEDEDYTVFPWTLHPWKCGRRRLRQANSLMLVRVRNQEKLLEEQKIHLEYGRRLSGRLRLQRERDEATLDDKDNQIINLQTDALTYRQRVRIYNVATDIGKKRIYTQHRANEELLIQKNLLAEQLASLELDEQEKENVDAVAETYLTTRNAYLREQIKRLKLQKKDDWRGQLFDSLVTLMESTVQVDPEEQRCFRVGLVERDGQAEVTCQEVSHQGQLFKCSDQICREVNFGHEGDTSHSDVFFKVRTPPAGHVRGPTLSVDDLLKSIVTSSDNETCVRKVLETSDNDVELDERHGGGCKHDLSQDSLPDVSTMLE